MATAVSPVPFGVSTGSVVGYPSRGSRYSLSAWVTSGAFTVGSRATVELVGMRPNGVSVVLGKAEPRLTSRWKHVSISSRISRATLVSLSVVILVQRDIVRGATFYVDGVRLVRHLKT